MTIQGVTILANQPWLETHSLSVAINALNTDIETMIAYIPVKEDDAVVGFTRYLREDVGTKWLPTHGQEASRMALTHVFGQIPQLVNSEETDQIDQGFKIGMTNNIALRCPQGIELDLSMPEVLSQEGIFVRSLITQIDRQKHIIPEFHRDQNVLTINFYAAGKGLIYRVNTPDAGPIEKETPSPCITIHRGTSHHFGQAGAVPHKGQSNRGRQAANIIWDMHRLPAAPSADY